MPLMAFIKAIEDSLGMEAVKEMLPMQSGDMEKTSADIKKAKEFLGYNPSVSIDYGVSEFVNWYMAFYRK